MAYSLGHRGTLTLVQIDIEDDAKAVAKILRDAGLKITATQVKKSLDDYAHRALEAAAEQAQESAREFIPVDSGELSEVHVDLKVNRKTAKVFIDTEDHTQYGRRQPEEAASLAAWLNLGGQGKIKLAGEKLEKDRGWIKRAQQDYASKYKTRIQKATRSR